ncbi:hypothetical protein HMI55_006090 [Coelomomyces lativittatus]|nr:hypothetical protein HMI55_006090 [Coelomomyces lativittatus]
MNSFLTHFQSLQRNTFLIPKHTQLFTKGIISTRYFTTKQEPQVESQTHFGFQKVSVNQKEKLVGDVFKSVAPSYDTMNDIMSMGIHRLWKNEFIRQMAPSPGLKLLDVAGGTGDIAFRFLDFIQKRHGMLGSSHVTIADINPKMLKMGQLKLLQSYPMYENYVSFEEVKS